ncbi:MAG: hypothetical protein OJF49_003368 [Ktedonobacterales bacterium]|nr:MAG: hypothetical protein OJF49_003368 [Ktedonobacterales bacterium]
MFTFVVAILLPYGTYLTEVVNNMPAASAPSSRAKVERRRRRRPMSEVDVCVSQ